MIPDSAVSVSDTDTDTDYDSANLISNNSLLSYYSVIIIEQSLLHADLHSNNVMMLVDEGKEDDPSQRSGDRRSRAFKGAVR